MRNHSGKSPILKMKSPTGVVDFLQVDRQSVEKDLGSSFSWAECPIEVAPPSPQKGRWSQSGSIAESDSLRSSSIANELEQVKRRLEWLQEQHSKDKEDYQEQLRQAKSQAREEIFQKYAPALQKASSAKLKYDGQVFETTKIVQYLRDDNARLREEIQSLSKAIAKQKAVNKELEAANKSALESYHDLENHVEGLTKVQEKLTENCKIFKQALASMKADYAQRTTYYNIEVKTASKYEKCLAKVLDEVKRKAAGGNDHLKRMATDVFETTEAAVVEVADSWAEFLSKSGINVSESKRKQILMKALGKKQSNDDSDSDSDSDSSESDSDSDSESDSDSDS